MFTASEVARMILEKTHNTLKKHEEMLQKSKNTAHEIDAGEEPKNDEAECPDSLKGEGASSASKSEPKKDSSPVVESEDSEMEDEPLSDDESEEDESEEDEEEEKFEFKKSESGMHTVQYKTLKKARVDEGKSDYVKRELRWIRKKPGKHEKGVHAPIIPKTGKSWAGDNSRSAAASERIAQRREQKISNPDDAEKEFVKDIKEGAKKERQAAVAEHKKVSDEAKNIKPNLPKSEENEKPLKKLMSSNSTMPGSVASTGRPSIGSQIGFPGIKKDEKNPESDKKISFKRFEEGEKKMTPAQQATVKRDSQNPSKTGPKFQDDDKPKGDFRRKKYKETGDIAYLYGHKDSEYKKD